MYMLQETLITFPVLKSDTAFSKTLSLLLQSLNGTIQILPFGTQKVLLNFKNSILKFIRRSPSNVFNCNNYKGIRVITMLRVGMSQLRDHKCKHNFQDPLNPIWSCGFDIESNSHFLLHCLTFNDERYNLLSNLNNIDCKLLEITKYSLSQTFFFYMVTHYLIKKKHTHC